MVVSEHGTSLVDHAFHGPSWRRSCPDDYIRTNSHSAKLARAPLLDWLCHPARGAGAEFSLVFCRQIAPEQGCGSLPGTTRNVWRISDLTGDSMVHHRTAKLRHKGRIAGQNTTSRSGS